MLEILKSVALLESYSEFSTGQVNANRLSLYKVGPHNPSSRIIEARINKCLLYNVSRAVSQRVTGAIGETSRGFPNEAEK